MQKIGTFQQKHFFNLTRSSWNKMVIALFLLNSTNENVKRGLKTKKKFIDNVDMKINI